MTPKLRLLPPDSELGWTPYAWLLYLGMLFPFPYFSKADTSTWAATALMVAVFLPLYFGGYWVERRYILPIAGAIALLGFFSVPINAGASVFWVYAGAFLGRLGTPRRAFRYLIGLTIAILVATWAMMLHPTVWVPGVVFTMMVGAINIHYDEVGRKNSELRLAQSEVRRLAREAERERIARDLHDLLGHTLSLIVLKSELASKLADRDPGRAATEIRDVESISRQALSEVRRAVQGYRGERASIGAELENARRALDAAGVRLDIETDGLEAIPSAEETVLALALRESVTNIIRHAEADRCTIRCTAESGGVRLDVEDDGVGDGGREGAGIRGMRERIEALGGRLERLRGKGTHLRIELPIHAVEPAR